MPLTMHEIDKSINTNVDFIKSFQMLNSVNNWVIFLDRYRETIQKVLPCKSITLFEYDERKKLHFVADVFPQKFHGFVNHQLEEGIISWAQLHNEVFISETDFFYDEFPPSKSIFMPLLQNKQPRGVIEILPENSIHLENGSVLSHLKILCTLISDKIEILKLSSKLAEKESMLERITNQFEMTNKMVSLGELAGSVAHEINNPMTTILGRLQLLIESNSLPDQVQNKMKVIETQANRVSKLIHALLSFARGNNESIDEEININQVINSSLDLTCHNLKINKIEISTNLVDDLPVIYGNPIQLQQVFINLINNAQHAMQAKGKLTIGTRLFDAGVCITIKDNGSGIDPKDHGKIFELLYSTKKTSGGTGLGLSICKQIVQKYNGTISVDSQLGQGTKFEIYIPFKSNQKKRKLRR